MKTNKKTLITVILLLIILCGTFAYSVKVRSPWFGKLSVGHHQWLTGSTLVFTKNWFRDGAFKSYFAMYENPKSIESPAKRGIYASYPPGAIIPIYAISKIINKEPTPAMVMSYNLANQFFIALLLIATVFIFLRRLGLPLFYTFLFSLIPLATELFLPAPMYWHQNVFFSDQAVILPFIFFIFLEILRDGLKKHKSAEQATIPTPHSSTKLKIIQTLQALTFFVGMFTDWFFFFIALVVYAKRLIAKEIPLPLPLKKLKNFFLKSLFFWLPGIIAIALFTAQLFIFNKFQELIDIFLFRTAQSSEGKTYVTNFLDQFGRWMSFGYGKAAIAAILLSLLVFLIASVLIIYKKFRKQSINPKSLKILSLIGITLIPCIIQVLCFQNHSVIHDFSILKFSIPLAIVPFILTPFLILTLLNIDISSLSISPKKKSDTNSRFMIFTIILAIFIIISTADKHPDHYKQDYFPPAEPNFIKAIKDIKAANIGYNDIIFSPEFDIPTYPPQLLSLTMKKVYKIDSLTGVKAKIQEFKNSGAKLDDKTKYRIILALTIPPDEITIAKFNLNKAKLIPGTQFIKFFVLENNQ